MKVSPEELLKEDTKSWDELYAYVRERVAPLLPREIDPDDVTTDTLGELCIALTQLRSATKFVRFLETIARRTRRRYELDRKLRRTIPLGGIEPQGEDDPTLRNPEREELLRELLAKLTEAERELFSLLFSTSKTMAQIEQTLGVSPDALWNGSRMRNDSVSRMVVGTTLCFYFERDG